MHNHLSPLLQGYIIGIKSVHKLVTKSNGFLPLMELMFHQQKTSHGTAEAGLVCVKQLPVILAGDHAHKHCSTQPPLEELHRGYSCAVGGKKD